MRYLVILLMYFFMSFQANAISWGAAIDRDGTTATFVWGWPSEDSEVVICNTSGGCLIVVGPWDPAGGPPAGGINNPSAIIQKVIVPNGATVKDAFDIWRNIYGNSGRYRQSMWTNTRYITPQTCYGFQSFAGAGGNFRTGRLLPGTTCGLIPPSNLTCDIIIPPEIDLGTVPRGTTGLNGSVSGSATCSDNATLNAVLETKLMISGNEVILSINNNDLAIGAPISVGSGTQIPLSIVARIPGSLNDTGTFSTTTVVAFSYN